MNDFVSTSKWYWEKVGMEVNHEIRQDKLHRQGKFASESERLLIKDKLLLGGSVAERSWRRRADRALC